MRGVASLALVGIVALVLASLPSCSAVRRPHRPGQRDRWRVVTTAHVRLMTDIFEDEAREMAWALEDFHRALAAGFFECGRPLDDVAVDVTMFADSGLYRAVAPHDAFGFMREGTNELATVPPHLVVPAATGLSRGAIMQTYVHELAHRFVHTCFPSAPVWLDEGLAMYFETVRVREDDLVVGVPPYRIDGEGPATGIRRDGVRQMRFDENFVAPSSLVAFTPGEFYRWDGPGGARIPHYASAWLLVHMLAHGPDADLRARFVRFLATMRTGDVDARAALTIAFEGTSLDAAFGSYVQSQPSQVSHLSYSAPSLGRPQTRAADPHEVDVRMAELFRRVDPARALEYARAAEADSLLAAHAVLLEASLDDPSHIEEHVARAVELAPNDREVVRAWAWVATRANRPTAERRALYQRFTRFEQPSALDRVRWSELARANADEQRAIELARGAAAAAPEIWDTWWELARAFEQAGRVVEARACLARAMNLTAEREPAIAGRMARIVARRDARQSPLAPDRLPALDPSSAVIDYEPSAPLAVSGVTGAGLDARTLGGRCVGTFGAEPALRLRVPSDAGRSVVWVESLVDTTLVVRAPSGQLHCDDDSGGRTAPAIDAAWFAGEVDVWVGAYDAADAGSAFTLHVDAERPMTLADRPTRCGVGTTRIESRATMAVGMRVVLGRHSPFSGAVDAEGHMVEGSMNSADAMDAFAGREARIVTIGGDAAGCGTAFVDVDDGQWRWRLRDMQPAP